METGAREIEFQWLHVAYEERSAFTETYGFSGSRGSVNLEGILIRPKGGDRAQTLIIVMHPTSTLQLLPLPRAAASAGAHVLCAATRYAKNDTALIMEKAALDLGAWIRHAKDALGYGKVVLLGWSGGGSLAVFYQSQAERPTIVETPAGDPVDLAGAGLVPADALIFQAAHASRARFLLENIDPSVRDETNPDDRDPALDIYGPACPAKPPYPADFIAAYRNAQRARVERIRTRVLETLDRLKRAGGKEIERGFVTHRTFADPRFLDGTLDPNGRTPGTSYLGDPAVVNSGPVALGRFSTLRAWLSQWSIADSRAEGVATAPTVTVPFLAIENGADDAVPQPHPGMVFAAVGSPDKTYRTIEGANHYYVGQPDHLAEAVAIQETWLTERGLIG